MRPPSNSTYQIRAGSTATQQTFDWAGVFTKSGMPVAARAWITPGQDAEGRVSPVLRPPFGVAASADPVKVTVTDDDGGTLPVYELRGCGNAESVTTTTWQAPVKDGMRNVVKHGNVIPLKIRVVRLRTGNPVHGEDTDRSALHRGRGARRRTSQTATVLLPTESVGSHTDGIMRYVDSHYMYNLATKPLKVGLPYTIVIREQGTNTPRDNSGHRAEEELAGSTPSLSHGRAVWPVRWRSGASIGVMQGEPISTRGVVFRGPGMQTRVEELDARPAATQARSGSEWRPQGSVTPTSTS